MEKNIRLEVSVVDELTLQERVKIFVAKNKILKKDFARAIGITPAKFSHWLKGRLILNRLTIEKILSILECE